MVKDSEFRAYTYIENVLKDLGWDTRNPARGGAVYTQREFYKHNSILTASLDRKAPENIILIPWDSGERYWIVEAKPTHMELGKALKEAQSYSDKVNQTKPGTAKFATGIAGTPDQSFYVTTTYWNGTGWFEVAINDYETTGFLTLEQCQNILDRNSNSLPLFDDDPNRFLRKANAINKTLHDNEVPVGDRASIMAALLLALAQDGNLRIHAKPSALMREINGHIEDLLRDHGKEEFAGVIKLALPATEKNHKKYRKAVIEVLQHLREMNIRSAINSGDDALGKFYETFLKYANGAKEMGIVLTPRHITRFAVDVLGVGPKDRVFDPACGTGGFLVSAMESIRNRVPDGYNQFKNDGLFGVEQRDDVYGLAVVNMIFRGDGKSSIYDGNCFDHKFWLRDGDVFYTLTGDLEPDGAIKPFTKVLMNPPFKLKISEVEFVNYGLEQIRKDGLLFAVLPAVAISGSTYESWRRQILKRHTVLACVKFDKNLFSPVSEATYGLILRSHEPHKSRSKVFMGFLFDDHHRPRKSKMLSDYVATDNVERMTKELHRFLLNQPVEKAISREQCVTTIDQDTVCDFSPERYVPAGTQSINASLRSINTYAAKRRTELKRPRLNAICKTATFLLSNLIEKEITAPLKTIKEYPKGSVPVVSATAQDNGIADWLEIPNDKVLKNCITISIIHNTKPCEAFWHPYEFSALVGKVIVLKPIGNFLDKSDALLYLCEAITTQNAWRYHYARAVKLEQLEVDLPITHDGQPDIETMSTIVQGQLS